MQLASHYGEKGKKTLHCRLLDLFTIFSIIILGIFSKKKIVVSSFKDKIPFEKSNKKNIQFIIYIYNVKVIKIFFIFLFIFQNIL